MLSAQSQLPLLSQHAAEGQDLSPAEIEQAIHDLLEPSISLETKAEFLVCLSLKGETAREIADFAILLRDLAIDPHIDIGVLGGKLLDTCGTGGDGVHTFNVSTAAAFVLAAADIPVAKHGNRSIGSKCGSADVLEALGVKIEIPPQRMREAIETLRLGFLYAPQYHKAFKAIQPVREHLAKQGKKTIFNLLGPLINPARPNIQVVGVYDPALTELYAQVLCLMKVRRAVVVHGYAPDGKSGVDELSSVSITKVSQLHSNGSVENHDLDPSTFGLRKGTFDELKGGDAKVNAEIIENLLRGKDTGVRRDFLLYNASVGFVLAGQASDIQHGLARASEVLVSGAAKEKLRAFREFTRS